MSVGEIRCGVSWNVNAGADFSPTGGEVILNSGSIGTIVNSNTLSFRYDGQTSEEGTVQGFPMSAADLSTGAHYAIYVTSRDADTSGTNRVYVGSQDGKVMAIRESELLTAGGGATVATANFGNWAGNGITTVSVVSTTPARLMVGTTQGTVYLLPLVPTGW